MLSPANQVIERNIHQLPAGKGLLIDPPDDQALSVFASLRPDIEWTVFTPYISLYQSLVTNSHCHVFCDSWLTAEQASGFDSAIIYYPKTKSRFDYYLSNISQLLKENASIFSVGEKKSGVKSCAKALTPFAESTQKLDAARHCLLFVSPFNNQVCPKNRDDWFSQKAISVNIDGQEVSISLYSLPGVFNDGKLDDGTQLLLNNIKNIPQSKINALDFGCGCGVIATSLSKRYSIAFAAVDVDALAVASSNKTFTENGVQATAYCSNGLEEVLKRNLKVDILVTNPPFHTGQKTDYSVTEQLLKNSTNLLKKDYQLWMVANHFLPYPELFKKYLKACQTVANNNRFNIYVSQSTI